MNIQQLVDRGESETLEFKEKFDERAIESAVAFANTNGGIVLIGVSDNGRINGIKTGKESLKNWANQMSQSTEPRLIPEIKDYELDTKEFGRKTIVAIRIREFPIKPVSLKGRCFKRVGNSNRLMPAQEIAQMHLDSTGMSWDKLPARGASANDIDIEKVKRYIKKANDTGRRKIDASEEPMQILEKLELLHEGMPSWAAILLFRKDAQRFISQAAIHCGRFREESIVIDDRLIEGTILEQIEEAMDFIRKNINVRFVMTGRPEREQVWDYPLEALREALINAVCHRDYTVSSNIEVRIYDDSLIIWSPGSLPSGITLEELYIPHSSKLRNKGIAGVLYDMELIEQWGSGIGKMRETCLSAGLTEPVLEEYQGFRVIFKKDISTQGHNQGIDLNARQVKTLMYVKEHGRITNKEYQELTGMSKPTATMDLKSMVKNNILKKIGTTGRGTEYILVE